MDHYSPEEITAILTVAREHSARDWIMFLVAYSHGLRSGEVCGPNGFTRAAVKDGHLIIQRQKGSLKTVQPLVTHENPLLDEKPALERWTAALPLPETRAFPISTVQYWRRFDKYRKLAGVRRLLKTRGVFKHSLAMHSIQTAGIENVRQYLGHRSLSSTGEYLRVSDSAASKAMGTALGRK